MRKVIAISLCAIATAFSISAGDVPTPEFYGIYMVVGGAIVTPRDAVAENRMGVCGTFMGGVDQGVRKGSGIRAASDSYLLLYGKDFESILRGKLARLTYRETVTVGSGLPMDPKSQCRVQMWMRAEDVPIRTAPVRTVPDLYRVVPAAPLTDGVYAFYYGSMDRAMIIEGAAVVFDFVVGDVAVPTGGPQSIAAGGGPSTSAQRAGGTGIGFLVAVPELAVYAKSSGSEVTATLVSGTPAANAKGGVLGVPGKYELEESNGRTRIVYMREREGKAPTLAMGWVDSDSLTRFPYDCTCDVRRCEPLHITFKGSSWNECFERARAEAAK